MTHPTDNNIDHTPMIKQYLQIKSTYPDYLVLYRMGDFYELFFQDAIKAANLLDLTLTKRGKSAGQAIEMAGVPYHTIDQYIYRLIKLGETVVICEQLGEPNNKGPMERKVTRIISPGTITEEELLPYKHANFIIAILDHNNYFGLAVLDLSTGWFNIININNKMELNSELERLKPIEIIVPKNSKIQEKISINPVINQLEQIFFTEAQVKCNLNQHFGNNFYKKFIQEHKLTQDPNDLIGLLAAGALLYYVRSMHQSELLHIKKLYLENLHDSIIIDQQTRKHLEITLGSQATNANDALTLLKILDHCQTSMGSRLLFNWINRPIKNQQILNDRYQAIEDLQHTQIMERIANTLSEIADLERIIARVATNSAKPRDLLQLKDTLANLPTIINHLSEVKLTSRLLINIMDQIKVFPELYELIDRAIVELPPITIKDGNVIATGYDQELDELRMLYNNADLLLNQIEASEKAKTKLSTLKIGFNKIQGYYLEVSRNQSKFIPNNYIRRQTLKNVERFISPELKTLEDQILSSRAKAIIREKYLFQEILIQLQQNILELQTTANGIAKLDVLNNLSQRAIILNWAKPILTTEPGLNIIAGRHPVVETAKNINFIPNNLDLTADHKMYIITGPNMGGKSTFMRQNALIVLLAYIGSFVPAYQATIGPIDRIFSRIGGADDLSQGKSTFMVEMLETANILQHATNNSLVIIDEIGRGTSTFDGISLAYGIAKYLIQHNQCFCLFATHFLELAKLADENPLIHNIHCTANETNGSIAFLYTIQPGPASKSFGLEVAKLAGIPETVINTAKAKLLELNEF